MKAFLLMGDVDFDIEAELPSGHEDLVADLGLEQVFEAMGAGDKFVEEVCKRVVLHGLESPGPVLYRQAILDDCMGDPQSVRGLYDIVVGGLADKRGFWGLSAQSPSSVLRGAVAQLEAQLEYLRQLRDLAESCLPTFRSEGFKRLFGSLRQELDDPFLETFRNHLRTLRFDRGVLMGAELEVNNSLKNLVLLSGARARRNWRERVGLTPGGCCPFSVHPRDEAGFQVLADLTSRGLNLVANAAAQSADHVASFFSRLRLELAFYLGCVNLKERLSGTGLPLCFPSPLPPSFSASRARRLWDPGLALRGVRSIVGNDLDGAGKPLVVVTGANSGGKSTFIRSLGLAQIMMRAGMFVAAEEFEAPVAPQVFTLFARGEDPALAHGRLEIELMRLSAIADAMRPFSLVLLNEAFSGTNEREGSEIGRQVVRALLELPAAVALVTHQFELADQLAREEGDRAVFLRASAPRGSGEDYRLVQGPPEPTSSGMDLYDRVGGW